MKCTACGNENQPGAKFCVHCGVVLMAAPPAAFSPTSTSAPMPYSSTATAQRPITPAPTPAAAMQAATPTPTVAAMTSAGAASAAAVPEPLLPPVAAPSSRTMGLAVAAIAGLVVIVGGGYFGYRMLAGSGAKQSTAAIESSRINTAPATPATAAEPPKDISPVATPESSSTMVATAPPSSAPAESTSSAASASTSASSPGASATPGKPAEVGKAPTGIPKTSAPKTPPQPQAVPAIPPAPAAVAPSAAPSKAPAKAPAVVAQAPAAAQADRWQALADEMARCRKEDLFSRFVCEQRTRAHYCEGYWGKVPQCPSTAPVDHGQ